MAKRAEPKNQLEAMGVVVNKKLSVPELSALLQMHRQEQGIEKEKSVKTDFMASLPGLPSAGHIGEDIVLAGPMPYEDHEQGPHSSEHPRSISSDPGGKDGARKTKVFGLA